MGDPGGSCSVKNDKSPKSIFSSGKIRPLTYFPTFVHELKNVKISNSQNTVG